jgi:predicted DCC family thiol-disulfide oxidoreductase YuxK
MVSAPAATASAPRGSHLLLYDGVCGLCSRLVRFILAHDRGAVFNFAPLQSPLGHSLVAASGGNPDELTSLYVFADYRSDHPRVFTRSDAALFVAGELRWPWRLLRVFGILPKAFLDRAYNVVARTRYRIFGRLDSCLLPGAELKSRFLE